MLIVGCGPLRFTRPHLAFLRGGGCGQRVAATSVITFRHPRRPCVRCGWRPVIDARDNRKIAWRQLGRKKKKHFTRNLVFPLAETARQVTSPNPMSDRLEAPLESQTLQSRTRTARKNPSKKSPETRRAAFLLCKNKINPRLKSMSWSVASNALAETGNRRGLRSLR